MEAKGIKGFKDILPSEIKKWQYLERKAEEVFENAGYSEIRIPLMEFTEVFSRSIGEDTDIVEKEMYTFQDKSGRNITLRPEGTAPVVRAYVEHGLYAGPQPARLYYLGPMFRYERPQAGRYRQFYQIGVEALGIDEPLLDAEVVMMLWHLFEKMKLNDLELQINSLGCRNCRSIYIKKLKEYLGDKLPLLCPDCKKRYDVNPLRVLDCKRDQCRESTKDVPGILDSLCKSCKEHFEDVKGYLGELSIPFKINQRIVRGLDYYTKTTFEVIAKGLGAQNAVAAGGRYDGLVEDMGGPPTPGIGFAIGVERVISLIQDTFPEQKPFIYLTSLGNPGHALSIKLTRQLRDAGIKAELGYGNSLKSQMKKADKSGAKFVLIIGDEEIRKGLGILRDMDTKAQDNIDLKQAFEILVKRLG
ncbi:MAG: histidine--tRNA ligase [Nitrospirota bacterium]